MELNANLPEQGVRALTFSPLPKETGYKPSGYTY